MNGTWLVLGSLFSVGLWFGPVVWALLDLEKRPVHELPDISKGLMATIIFFLGVIGALGYALLVAFYRGGSTAPSDTPESDSSVGLRRVRDPE